MIMPKPKKKQIVDRATLRQLTSHEAGSSYRQFPQGVRTTGKSMRMVKLWPNATQQEIISHLRHQRLSYFNEYSRREMLRTDFSSRHQGKGPKRWREIELEKERAFIMECKERRKNIIATTTQTQHATAKLVELHHQTESEVRFENAGRVMSELGRKDPFAGYEGAFVKPEHLAPASEKAQASPYSSGPRNPAYHADGQIMIAGQIANWTGHAKYTSAIYFRSGTLRRGGAYGTDYWGYLKETTPDDILAVQIFTSAPKELVAFTRGMLKRRKGNPVVILDVYGRPFFP